MRDTGSILVLMCAFSACDGHTGSSPPLVVLGTSHSQSASSTLTLPIHGTDYALDLNGDGLPDNQLGRLIGALAGFGVVPQVAVTASTVSGEVVLLFDEQSTDATQQNAQQAGINLSIGNQPPSPPRYDGTDTFIPDAAYAPMQLYGNITNGAFASDPPAKATTPVQLTLLLELVVGQPPIILPVTAGALSYRDVGGVLSGQINGAITPTDVGMLIPAITQLLNDELHAPDPPPAFAMFEMGSNCEGITIGTDCVITTAEVMSDPTIASAIAPDVQLYQNGVYDPSHANKTPDSISIGIGFTAVKATF